MAQPTKAVTTTDKKTTMPATVQEADAGLRDIINKASKDLSRALPTHMKSERLVRIALTCIRTTPKLGLCTPASFLGALFTAAQLGVEPIAGRAYLIPFNNSFKGDDGKWGKRMEAQFVLGYKGVVDLFYRHAKSTVLRWDIVKENDTWDYENGSNAFIRHKHAATNRGKTIAFWVLAQLANGGQTFQVMNYDECMAHGKQHSKTFITKAWDNGKLKDVDPHFDPESPWATDEDSMCLKTTLLQLSKILPLSSDLQRALQQDETARNLDPDHVPENMLDIPSTTDWKQPEPTPDPAAEPAAKVPEAAAVTTEPIQEGEVEETTLVPKAIEQLPKVPDQNLQFRITRVEGTPLITDSFDVAMFCKKALNKKIKGLISKRDGIEYLLQAASC